jgi:uroporphyrinogen-III synthase
VTPRVVAERLVAQLEASGFVVMHRPTDTTTPQRPEGWPYTKPKDLK